ncbi:MAG TPA: methyltransferase, partial [Alcanivorax sp.]|nr:methyltransferase [Alcanivorax sp.]
EGLIEDFHDRTLKPWWPAARWLVIEGYRSVTLPWPELEGPPPMPLERQWHWQDMAGYLDTWSALVKARDHGDDPLAAFLPVLREHWGEAERTVRWPLQLRVCARPPRPAG